jgi:hypothetical protein
VRVDPARLAALRGMIRTDVGVNLGALTGPTPGTGPPAPTSGPGSGSGSGDVGEAEDGFTRTLLQVAGVLGWKAVHFRPARMHDGSWRTPVEGDGVGWPDVVMVHPGRGELVVAELKVGGNTTTAEQDEWLAAFRAAGVWAFVWRPGDWPEIERVLKGDR